MKKWVLLLSGTTVAAFGMTFLMQSGLGNVILNVLWDGMSKNLGISIGIASYITSVMMILFSLGFDRSQVRIGTVVHFLLFGALMDFFMVMPLQSDLFLMKFFDVMIGIFFLNLGIGIYAYADMGRGPYEGICFALSDKLGIELKIVRSILDASFTVIGFLLGGLVGIATLLNIIFGGLIIQKTMTLLDNMNNRPRRRKPLNPNSQTRWV